MPVSPLFKGTLFYQTDIYGWSETHFLNAADMGTAGNNLGAINDAGQNLRRPEVKLVGARVVDATSPRVSINPPTALWERSGTYANVAATATINPNLAMLFREYDATNTHRSRVFFRGLPSNFLDADHGGPELNIHQPPDAVALITAYKNILIAKAVMAHRLAPHSFDEFGIDTVIESTALHSRKAGRPFGLPLGRRLIA